MLAAGMIRARPRRGKDVMMTTLPSATEGARRRIVLIDFDWQDADLLPSLLRKPGVVVRLVAGERTEDAGLRMAEVCGLPRTLDLADLTREIFDVALVSDRSQRRQRVQSLLEALRTPCYSPAEFLESGAQPPAPPGRDRRARDPAAATAVRERAAAPAPEPAPRERAAAPAPEPAPPERAAAPAPSPLHPSPLKPQSRTRPRLRFRRPGRRLDRRTRSPRKRPPGRPPGHRRNCPRRPRRATISTPWWSAPWPAWRGRHDRSSQAGEERRSSRGLQNLHNFPRPRIARPSRPRSSSSSRTPAPAARSCTPGARA
jgi:hypothetical protein